MSRPYPCVYCTEDGYCEKYSDEEVTSWCIQGPCKDEKPSNADRIRAMTDEELAKQIAEWNQGDCPPTWNQGDCPTIVDCPETQKSFACEPWRCWLDWLKEEIDDGNS